MAAVGAVLVLSAQTGTPVAPSLAPFEAMISAAMKKYSVTGAALAVTHNGRLVLARGYGYADQENKIPVQPDSRFRVASLSKLITAVTVMHLVEEGKLSLDQPAFAMLAHLQPPAGAKVDPRLASITIRQLLNHAGGFPENNGEDPMFDSVKITSALKAPAPASTENIIRYVLGQPLQFDPGTQYAYSNFGYAVLGRIIEKTTGMSYEQYVRTNVLAPMGISQMRIGQTLAQGQQPNEVKYYPQNRARSVFPDTPVNLTWPYGGWYMESMDSHGAWIASAIDYARFVNAIDGRRGRAFLSPASLGALTAKPAGVKDWVGQSSWYGFGVMVRRSSNDGIWWHSGLLDGTVTYQIRSNDGTQYVVFLNYTPTTGTDEDNLFAALDDGFWNAVGQVSLWPAGDQFTNYPDSKAAVTAPAIATREGVVNGATFDRGVVAGSWITVFGVNLANSMRTWTAGDIVNGALPLALDGVSVTVDGRAAAVYYISPTQLNVQAPAGLTPGWVNVQVTNNGASTGTVLAHVVNNAPGALTFLQNGVLYAVATNASYQVLAGGRTAPPGETIIIYATGLAASPAGRTLTAPVPVPGVGATMGGRAAAVSFAGVIAPGLFQVNVAVPEVGSGDQPLVLTMNGASSPAGVFVPVGR